MANKFNILITATDRATAVVRRFKRNVADITKPVRDTLNSVRKFSKEIGLTKIAKGFTNVAKFAASAAGKILSAGAAMAGIAAAASLVALADWTRSWGEVGAAVVRSSAIIGISTTRIQSLSGAAEVFGLKAEDMTAGLQAIGDALEDAVSGRNQQAMALMNRLGITLKRTKDGAVDTAAALMDVSRAIARQRGAQQQAVIANTFGVGGLLPLLQRGPQYIANLEAQVKATRAVMDPDNLKHATEFQQKLALLTLSVTGLGNSLGNRLLPFLTPAIGKLTIFIEKISEAIVKHQEALLIGQGMSAIGGALGVGPRAPLRPGGKPRPPMIQWNSKGTPLEYNWMNPFNGWGIPGMLRQLFSGDNHGGPAGGQSEAQAQAAIRRLFSGARITSGYRTPAHNREVGGKPNSYHIRGEGQALDFVLSKYVSLVNIRRKLALAGMPVRELLNEGDHIHWAWGAGAGRRNGRAAPPPDLSKVLGAGGRRPVAQAPGGGAAAPAQVDVHFHNAPAGMRATVKPGAPVKTNVKIAHAMPDLSTP